MLSVSVRPALVGALGMLLVGCLPPHTNPRCGSDEVCLAVGDGWCNCIDGLCFKFDCPAVPPRDDTFAGDAADSDSDTPGATADVGDPCAEASAGEADGCCLFTLLDHRADPDCVAAEGTLSNDVTDVGAPVRLDDGRLAIPAIAGGAARLYVLSPSLEVLDSIEVPDGASVPRNPVRLGAHTVAIGGDAGLLVIELPPNASPGLAQWDTGGPVASMPHPLSGDDGGVVLVTVTGAVVEVGPAGLRTDNAEPLIAASPEIGTAHLPELNALVTVSGGVMAVVGYESQTVLDMSDPVGFTGHPAVGALSAVYAPLADGQLGGRVRQADGGWESLPTTFVGAQPLTPVIGVGERVAVPTGGTTKLVVLEFIGQTVNENWAIDDALPDRPSTPALFDSAGDLYVGLRGGHLLCIDAGARDVKWQLSLDADAAGAPLQLPGGDVIAASATGQVVRVRTGATPAPGPWPRFRADEAASGAAQ